MAGNDVKDGTVVKHYDVAIFIKDTENYFQQKKSTQLEVSIDIDTEEKQFIADKNATVIPKSAKISLANDLYTIKGEKDFEFLFNLYLNLPKGMPAPLDTLVVYKAFGSKETGYKAWHFPKTQLLFTSYNAMDSVLNYDYNFGDGEIGTVNMSTGTPKFQADPEA